MRKASSIGFTYDCVVGHKVVALKVAVRNDQLILHAVADDQRRQGRKSVELVVHKSA